MYSLSRTQVFGRGRRTLNTPIARNLRDVVPTIQPVNIPQEDLSSIQKQFLLEMQEVDILELAIQYAKQRGFLRQVLDIPDDSDEPVQQEQDSPYNISPRILKSIFQQIMTAYRVYEQLEIEKMCKTMYDDHIRNNNVLTDFDHEAHDNNIRNARNHHR